jgi:hypothetical protein
MKEIYLPVRFYAINEIYKKYSGFPLKLPLPVHVQHGWTIIVGEHDAREQASENWYWSRWLENKYKEQFENITTRAVGSPFLYLLKLLDYRELPISQRQGSIVFPCHSSPLVDVNCDYEEYAARLDKLPDQYKPITICMYYIDLKKGYDRAFRQKGFSIVTNGSRESNSLGKQSFLENFVENTQNKLYAFSNQLGSALFFSTEMGLTSYYFGPEINVDRSRSPFFKDININQVLEWEEQYAEYFKFPNCDKSKQKAIVSRELGSDCMLSPSQMRKVLWRSTLNKNYINQLTNDFKTTTKQRSRQLAGKIKRKVLP